MIFAALIFTVIQ
jgi:hypothetical protein